VGDIIDFVSMENGWYWPQSHNATLQKLLVKAEYGTRIVYLPGNHDAVLRKCNEISVPFHDGKMV
jgi:UDP-2,3-diacylglucosamine pyrophosphatase LpxH